jgi:hypothetical protein
LTLVGATVAPSRCVCASQLTAGSLPRCRWPIFHVQTSRSMHVCRCTEREPRPGVCAEWYNGGSACGQGRPQERRGSAAEPSRPAEGRLAGLFEQPSVLRKWEAYQVRPLSVSASQPLSPVSCCCYVHTYDGRFHTGCCMIEARSRRLSTFLGRYKFRYTNRPLGWL